MAKYVLKRILILIPSVIIVVTIVFLAMRLVPGSPATGLILADGEALTKENIEKYEEKLGLNDPLIVQYFRYLGGIFTGNWGTSYFDGYPVLDNILRCCEPTLLFGYMATLIMVIVGIPIGILSATHRNSPLDYIVTTASSVLMVIPGFVLGLGLIYLLGYKLGWFPVVGFKKISEAGFRKAVYSLMLPALTSGLHGVAAQARFVRTTMLDVMRQDYIRTARAKGLSRNRVYYKHALKNTLSVTGTNIIYRMLSVLGGAAILETVFNIRGVGRLAVDAMSRRDYPQEQAIILFMSFISLGADVIVDIFLKALDPRVRFE